MTGSIYLGDGADDFIRVTPMADRLEFVCGFAERCFHVGEFKSRMGAKNRWQLDCREGLGNGPAARAIADEFVRVADTRGIRQFAGAGFGAYLLVGAILVSRGTTAQGALLRTVRKKYGRERAIEGLLDPGQPVCLVDDILNSGRSASQAVHTLRRVGCRLIYHLSIFRFDWGDGVRRLGKFDVDCGWLAEVSRPEDTHRSTETRGSLGAKFWRPWSWLCG